MLRVFFAVFSINPTQAIEIEQKLFERDTQVCFLNFYRYMPNLLENIIYTIYWLNSEDFTNIFLRFLSLNGQVYIGCARKNEQEQ